MARLIAVGFQAAPLVRFFDDAGNPQAITLSPGPDDLDPTHVQQVVALAFSVDGTKFAVSVRDDFDNETWVYAYDIAASVFTNVLDDTMAGGTGASDIAYSPDGTMLAVALRNTPYLKIYDTTTWTPYSAVDVDVTAETDVSPRIAFSPDSTMLAIGCTEFTSTDDKIRVYDVTTTSPTSLTNKTLAATEFGQGLAFTSDGDILFSGFGSTSSTLRLYDTTSWSLMSTPPDLLPAAALNVRIAGNTIAANTDSTTHVFYNTGGSADPTTWTRSLSVNGSSIAGFDMGPSVSPVRVYSIGTDGYIHEPPTQDVASRTLLTDETPDSAYGVAISATATEGTIDDLEEDLEVADAGSVALVAPASDSFSVSAAVLSQLDFYSRELVNMTAALSLQANYNLNLTALVQLQQALVFGFTDLLTVSFSVDDTLDSRYTAFGDMVERVLVDPALSSMLQAQAVLAEAIAASAMAVYFNDADATEEVVLDAAQTELLRAMALAEDLLTAVGVPNLLASMFVAVADTVSLTSLPVSQAQLVEMLSEVFRVTTLVDIAGDTYQVLAVNAATGAVTRYTNYAFESMARVGVDYVGAAEDGLYQLEGDYDDGGQPIYASIKTGTMDFGIPELKRVANAYVGLSKSGRLMVKVTTSDRAKGGAPIERWYTLKQPTRGGTGLGGRLELGLGVKSRYWQFEPANVDGDDFEIDAIDLDLIRLTRRG